MSASLTDISFVDESVLKDHFLAELARFGYVVIAEDETGLKGYHKRWVRDDAEYAMRAEEAKEAFKGVIFREIIRRGVVGNKRKRFHKGNQIIDPETGEQYVEFEQSDRLLLALAAALAEQPYRSVASLIAKLQKQAADQVKENVERSPEKTTRRPSRK